MVLTMKKNKEIVDTVLTPLGHLRISKRPDNLVFIKYPNNWPEPAMFVTVLQPDIVIGKPHHRFRGMFLRIIPGSLFAVHEFLNFDSPYFKPEYEEILREYDKVTPLNIWCGLHGIPYRKFTIGMSRRRLLTVIGDIHIISLKPTSHKKRRAVYG